jgi:hypothetical protein
MARREEIGRPETAALQSRKRTVLIGFAESLSAPEVTWNLLDAGFLVAAYTRRGHRPPLRRIKDIRLIEVPAPEDDARECVEQVRSAIQIVSADAVLPLDDASVWLCDAVSLGIDVPIAGPTGNCARLALDKRLQLEVAREAGFNVLPTQYIGSVEEASEIEDFPAVLKPALAVAEVKGKLRQGRMHVCPDRRQLSTLAAQFDDGLPMLAQPVLEGTGEGLFGLAGANGVQNWSAHQRIRMMNPQGSGSSACRSVPITDQPMKSAERMLMKANWRGMFMVELLRDRSNRIWFMELNGRSWGSMALALRMGLEYPSWTVEQRLDPCFAPPAGGCWKPIVCRHLGREIVHALMVLGGRKPIVPGTGESRLRTLREVSRFSLVDRWYNWRPGNELLFLEDTIVTVLGRALSRLRPV